MKKLLFAIALLSGIGFTIHSAVSNTQPAEILRILNADEFTEIEIAEVPKAVTDAVAKKFEGSTLKKAEVNKETMIYQITVTTADGKEVICQFKESGEETEATTE